MKKTLLIIIVFLCSTLTQAAAPIKITGSSTVAQVVVKVDEAFQKTHPKLKINILPTSSELAVKEIAEGTADIGMISGDLKDQENKLLKSVTIARDGISPCVSMEVYMQGVKSISLEDLTKIYSGKTKSWTDLGGPDRQIVVIEEEDSSAAQSAVAQSTSAIARLSYIYTNDRVRALGSKIKKSVIYPTT